MNYKFTKREIVQQLSDKFDKKDTVVAVNYILEKLNINICNVAVESLNKLKKIVSVNFQNMSSDLKSATSTIPQ